MYRRYQPSAQTSPAVQNPGSPHENQNYRLPQQQKYPQTNTASMQNQRSSSIPPNANSGQIPHNGNGQRSADQTQGFSQNGNLNRQNRPKQNEHTAQHKNMASAYQNRNAHNGQQTNTHQRQAHQTPSANRPQNPFFFSSQGQKQNDAPPPREQGRQKNFLFDLLPPALYNHETKKILGLINAEDLLLIALIFMFLDSDQPDHQLLVYALLYILLSDYIDLPI